MKKPIIILAFLGACLSSFAQTNTFPATGSAGIGTLYPSFYYHGGNNKVLEIYNSNTTLNSQSHLVLTTGSILNDSGAGSISWMAKNSAGFQGMAYIGSSLEGDATNNATGRLVFATSNGSAPFVRMMINKDGNVGIGTMDPVGYKLAVAGNMIAESVRVKLHGAWPDFVFAKDYKLPSLQATEKHILANGHLPGIPSAAEVAKDGIELGEMDKKLLQKIEELTLYLIEMKKENDSTVKKLGQMEIELQKLQTKK